jgi:hypothetical protein
MTIFKKFKFNGKNKNPWEEIIEVSVQVAARSSPGKTVQT